jgi:hypothetical protein
VAIAGGGGRGLGDRGGPAVADEPPGREEILVFLDDLRRLVGEALERPALWHPYARRLRLTWPRVASRFVDIDLGVREADLDALARHGLTGVELRLKLAVFDGARAEFSDVVEGIDRSRATRLFGNPVPYVPLSYPEEELWEVDETIHEGLGLVSRVVRGGAKKLAQGKAKVALKIGDAILGSIALAVPGVSAAAGAVGEFKGMMEGIAGG